MASPLLFVTALALVDEQKRVLLTRRPEGKALAGLWEFPGGKLQDGETPEDGLVREIREELGLSLAAEALTPLTFASHAYDAFHLFMPLYLCRSWRGEPEALEGQALAWVHLDELNDYAMPPADGPLSLALRAYFYGKNL